MFDIPGLFNDEEHDEYDGIVTLYKGSNSLIHPELIEDSELNKRVNRVRKDYSSPIGKIRKSQKTIKQLYGRVDRRIKDVVNNGMTKDSLEFEKEGFKTLVSLIGSEISAINNEASMIDKQTKAVQAERKAYYGEKTITGGGNAIGNGQPTSAANYASVMKGIGVGGAGASPIAINASDLNGGGYATNIAPGSVEAELDAKLRKDREGDKEGEKTKSPSETVETTATEITPVVTPEASDGEAVVEVGNSMMIGSLEDAFDEESDLDYKYSAVALDLRNKSVESVLKVDPASGKYWPVTKNVETGEEIEGFQEHIDVIEPSKLDLTTATSIDVTGVSRKVEIATEDEMPDHYKEQWNEKSENS